MTYIHCKPFNDISVLHCLVTLNKLHCHSKRYGTVLYKSDPALVNLEETTSKTCKCNYVHFSQYPLNTSYLQYFCCIELSTKLQNDNNNKRFS